MKARPFALCLLLACLTACQPSTPPAETKSETAPPPKAAPPQPKAPVAELPPRDPADTVDRERRIPGDYHGNYVWAAATNLAWREIMDSILHGPAQMEGLDANGKSMLDRLNESEFSRKDLDASSFYAKAGFGNETLDEIRGQMARKFPMVDPQLEDVDLLEMRFIAYACLMKDLKYISPFRADTVQFRGKNVKGFRSKKIMDKIRIVEYRSDDDFVIQMLLKDEGDQLYLCKGFAMGNPGQALRLIEKSKNRPNGIPSDIDSFEAPILHIKFTQSFEPLCNHHFTNAGFSDQFIAAMYQYVEFDMDEAGVKVVAMTPLTGKDAIKGGAPEEPKHFYLDQPYWVILKRRDSPRPYFILGVRNTAMMTPVRKK